MPIVETLYGQMGGPEPPPLLRYAAGAYHESVLRMNLLQAEEAVFANLERHGLSKLDSFDPKIKVHLSGGLIVEALGGTPGKCLMVNFPNHRLRKVYS